MRIMSVGNYNTKPSFGYNFSKNVTRIYKCEQTIEKIPHMLNEYHYRPLDSEAIKSRLKLYQTNIKEFVNRRFNLKEKLPKDILDKIYASGNESLIKEVTEFLNGFDAPLKNDGTKEKDLTQVNMTLEKGNVLSAESAYTIYSGEHHCIFGIVDDAFAYGLFDNMNSLASFMENSLQNYVKFYLDSLLLESGMACVQRDALPSTPKEYKKELDSIIKLVKENTGEKSPTCRNWIHMDAFLK